MHSASGSSRGDPLARLLVVHVVRLEGLDAEPGGRLGHRRRRQLASPPARPVGARDHQLRAVRTERQPVENLGREVRGSEVDGAHRGEPRGRDVHGVWHAVLLGFPGADPGKRLGEQRGRNSVYTQDFDPVSDSLGLTAIFAALPVLTLFVLLGGLRMKAQWAALISLGVAMLVALIVYGMPAGQTLLSASEGATFGLFPIMWIVIAAIWVYNMTVETGHFAVLRRSFGAISDDQRVQAVIVAFCFGALLEALAGFGTPVAITAVMLIALGFKPIKAASVALVANTAPVAFGAIATPIITLSEVTELPKDDLGAMVGRQTPVLALIVPLILVFMVDGRRGVRQVWPVAVLGGMSFAVGQFLCANYFSVELTDIVASLLATGSIVAFLRVWSPSEPLLGDGRRALLPAGRGRRLGALPDARARDRAPRRQPARLHRAT